MIEKLDKTDKSTLLSSRCNGRLVVVVVIVVLVCRQVGNSYPDVCVMCLYGSNDRAMSRLSILIIIIRHQFGETEKRISITLSTTYRLNLWLRLLRSFLIRSTFQKASCN